MGWEPRPSASSSLSAVLMRRCHLGWMEVERGSEEARSHFLLSVAPSVASRPTLSSSDGLRVGGRINVRGE